MWGGRPPGPGQPHGRPPPFSARGEGGARRRAAWRGAAWRGPRAGGARCCEMAAVRRPRHHGRRRPARVARAAPPPGGRAGALCGRRPRASWGRAGAFWRRGLGVLRAPARPEPAGGAAGRAGARGPADGGSRPLAVSASVVGWRPHVGWEGRRVLERSGDASAPRCVPGSLGSRGPRPPAEVAAGSAPLSAARTAQGRRAWVRLLCRPVVQVSACGSDL